MNRRVIWLIISVKSITNKAGPSDLDTSIEVRMSSTSVCSSTISVSEVLTAGSSTSEESKVDCFI